MNIVVMCITKFLMELLSMSSLADTFDSGAMNAAASFHGTQPVAALLRMDRADSTLASDGAVSTLGGRVVRTHDLAMKTFRTGMLQENDRAAFSIYAPTKSVNRALSFMRAVSGASLNETLVSWVQGLSALGKRQLNAEFNYSSRTGKHSEINSSVAYRLNPDNFAGKSDVIATLRYSANF